VIPEVSRDFLAHEYYNDDIWKMTAVAGSAAGVATLEEVTGGGTSRSPGFDQYARPYGADKQLLLTLRSRTGTPWGMLALYRNADQPNFARHEIEFLNGLSRSLAEGARRGMLLGEAADPDRHEAPNLVVIEDWAIQSSTPGTEALLAELPGGATGSLPTAVLSVAAKALRSLEARGGAGEVVVARVRSDRGMWCTIHGSPLLSAGARRVAVIIERADPDRLAPLLMDAYELSHREKDVTQLILRGESTGAIARTLFISPATVQQHLKSVFEKTGVRSRRELTGNVFFAHYEPRVADNEARTSKGLPMRDGPMPARR